MHFLATVSDDPKIMFRLELLLRSLKHFAGRDYHFSTVLTGREVSRKWSKESMAVADSNVRQHVQRAYPYVAKHSEVFYCPYHYVTHPPCRWFVPIQSDPCVFIDADVLCCSSLEPLAELSKDRVRGLTVYSNDIDYPIWLKLADFREEDMQFYFNYGVVVVPQQFIPTIGEELFTSLPSVENTLTERFSYYAGQVGLCRALKVLKIRRGLLPMRFNFADCMSHNHYSDEFSKLVFYHYFTNKGLISGPDAHSKLKVLTGNEQHVFLLDILNKVCPRITV